MIFGSFDSSGFEIDIKKIPHESFSNSENFIHFKYELYFSEINIIFNKKYYKKIVDFLKFNKKNKILFLIYGNIFNITTLKEKYDLSDEISEIELVEFLFFLKSIDFVDELNGDFVIVIYQPEVNLFYIFRDHLGIYPLAYFISNESLVFSSDEISLCKEFQDDNPFRVEPLLTEFRFADLKQTVNNKVNKLLPGYYLKYKSGVLSVKKYWKPEKIKTDFTLTQNQVLRELNALVKDAVHIRSDERFTAAAHVSGGLDSSLVAALVRKEYQKQETFYGYSWSPANFEVETIEFDERDFIKMFCDTHSITPFFIDLSVNDCLTFSVNYIRNFGAFYEQKVLEHTKENNVNLIFSGWGGDEFFSKGASGVNLDLILQLKLSLFFKRNSIFKFRNFLRILSYEVILPFFNIVNPSVKKSNDDYTKYLKEPYNRYYSDSVKSFFCYKSRKDLHLGFLYHYHIPERTEKSFINGFLNGVEYRYPLLDKRIIEYMLKVPSHLLVDHENDRLLIRKISEGILPNEIRNVRKGSDPVLWEKAKKLNREVVKSFVCELEDFKKNPDLSIFDFVSLEQDIDKFNSGEFDDYFISSVYSIKFLHEFTKRYRDKRSLFLTN